MNALAILPTPAEPATRPSRSAPVDGDGAEFGTLLDETIQRDGGHPRASASGEKGEGADDEGPDPAPTDADAAPVTDASSTTAEAETTTTDRSDPQMGSLPIAAALSVSSIPASAPAAPANDAATVSAAPATATAPAATAPDTATTSLTPAPQAPAPLATDADGAAASPTSDGSSEQVPSDAAEPQGGPTSPRAASAGTESAPAPSTATGDGDTGDATPTMAGVTPTEDSAVPARTDTTPTGAGAGADAGANPSGRGADLATAAAATEAPSTPVARTDSAARAAHAGAEAGEQLLRMAELVDAARATTRHRGTERIVLELHPAELGTVTVDLRLDGQAVNLSLRAGHPGAVERILGELAQLRQELADAGVHVGNVDVDSGPPDRSRDRDALARGAEPDARRQSLAQSAASEHRRHSGVPILTNGRLAVDL